VEGRKQGRKGKEGRRGRILTGAKTACSKEQEERKTAPNYYY
jgi:hypothetical protein